MTSKAQKLRLAEWWAINVPIKETMVWVWLLEWAAHGDFE